MKILSLCSAIALASTGYAQIAAPNDTIPPGYLKVPGNTFLQAAFGFANGRHQNLYSPAAAGTTTKALALINLWVRADEFMLSQGGHSYDVEIIVSSKGSKWRAPGMKSFASNHGTDKRVFFRRARINFPKTIKRQAAPRPWTISFKSRAPFIVRKGEGLVIDVKSYAKTTSFMTWWADSAHDSYRGTVTKFGKSCPGNFRQSTGHYYVGASGRWMIRGTTQGLGDLAFAWLGSKRTNIPFPPRSGCFLFTLPLVVHPQIIKTTSSQGLASWYWGMVPASLAGKKMISQIGAITPKGQLKLSYGLEVEFGPGKSAPSSVLSVYGSAFGPWKSFNPDRDAPRFGPIRSAVIFGRN